MKKAISKNPSNSKLERCSSVACNQKPIIEIVAWNGITLDTHLFLCRNHWAEKCAEGDSTKMKVIHFLNDLRTYL